jgi:alkylmercury lyase
MDQSAFEKYVDKTRQDLAALPEGAYEAELRLQVIALQLLAKGAPVSPDALAEAWGLPLEHVQAIIEQASALGTLQLDDAGNLVGTAISLVPSRHKFQVGEKTLYAWCAYDAVYTPGVIGESAVIESVDPLSNEPIRLKISSEGVLESEPEGVVATVVGMDADASGGVESPRCSLMQFFVSEENASTWSAGQPGVSVMTVDQLFDLAMEFQIEPARQMGLLGTQ